MTISVEDNDHIALEDLNSFDQRIDLMLALTGVSDHLWFAPAGLRFRGSLYHQRGHPGPSMGLPELRESRVEDPLGLYLFCFFLDSMVPLN